MFLKIIVSVVMLISLSQAKMFQSVDVKDATLLEKGVSKMFCDKCGMNLPKFYKSNHALKYGDGVKQFCSMHCLVEAIETDKKGELNKNDIQVVDAVSLKFIPVSKATYVVGSKIKGTMSMVSKYAFADAKKAKEFQAKNGGDIMDFDAVFKKAQASYKKEMKMIHKKRAKMMYNKGKKVYKMRCNHDKLNALSANTIGEMKTKIIESGVCGKLKPMQYQVTTLYYWDVVLGHGK